MPSIFIEKVSNADNETIGFKTRARALKGEPVVGQRSCNFPTLAKAKAYGKKLQASFDKGDYSFFSEEVKHHTVGLVINDYLENPLTKKHVKSRHISPLNMILQTSFASVTSTHISAYDWYMLALQLNENLQVKPQTTANYLSILNSALKDSATMLRYAINLDSYSTGLSTARRLGLIAKSDERTRRPTELELNAITSALTNEEQNKRRTIPMLDIVEFAIETAARVGEICGGKLVWRNWDAKSRLITIRNRKSPNGKKIHSRFELSPKAIEIIMRQPRGNDDDPIFPYNPKTVGQYWRDLMKDLNIEDLRFHDLRAEGLCRLYEKGWSLSAISKVSGHRDVNILNNVYLRFFPAQISPQAA
ncbi:site-specific integrase [Vibrio aestuarianus]|uniref:site-specific integrase n=1 Tax=Vibrio aestuarianus TaxID=28171 RepID=UPI00155842A6|nr:site-specific integrase [Vibrio aestuarianus]NGZ14986.1 site-specific integrase [Vibrio aestuarianus]NKZ51134.1 site-specific integrase [Vibrio aestuarianus]